MKEAVADFWSWWPSVAGEFDSVFAGEAEMTQELIDSMSAHVHAIDDTLDWEFGPGKDTKHHLCLSGKGNPVKRVITERWLRGAPPPDGVWEFYPARQAHPGGTLKLELDDIEFDFEDIVLTFADTDGRPLLDVELFHPSFSKVDENAQRRVTFIALDNALGEDDLERWVGSVEVAHERPEDGKTLSDLKSAVAELAAKGTDNDWVILKGTSQGKQIVITVDRSIKRVNHLLMDQHVEITLTLMHPAETGFTVEREADVLNKMEDQLVDMLGNEAVYIGRETVDGKRHLHFHVMIEGPTAGIIDRWRKTFADYEMSVEVTPDPRWEILRRWG